MDLPKDILVPIDLSPCSEHALDYAVALATKVGAKVHLLNVVGIPSMAIPELGIGMTATLMDEILRANQKALEQLAESRRSTGVIGDVMLRTGDARDLILGACEEKGADLIVMGTHGRRGVSRALLGSVAESVLRTAACPVLTIRDQKASK